MSNWVRTDKLKIGETVSLGKDLYYVCKNYITKNPILARKVRGITIETLVIGTGDIIPPKEVRTALSTSLSTDKVKDLFPQKKTFYSRYSSKDGDIYNYYNEQLKEFEKSQT